MFIIIVGEKMLIQGKEKKTPVDDVKGEKIITLVLNQKEKRDEDDQ